jgi:hypothetical protein
MADEYISYNALSGHVAPAAHSSSSINKSAKLVVAFARSSSIHPFFRAFKKSLYFA